MCTTKRAPNTTHTNHNIIHRHVEYPAHATTTRLGRGIEPTPLCHHFRTVFIGLLTLEHAIKKLGKRMRHTPALQAIACAGYSKARQCQEQRKQMTHRASPRHGRGNVVLVWLVRYRLGVFEGGCIAFFCCVFTWWFCQKTHHRSTSVVVCARPSVEPCVHYQSLFIFTPMQHDPGDRPPGPERHHPVADGV